MTTKFMLNLLMAVFITLLVMVLLPGTLWVFVNYVRAFRAIYGV